MAMRPPVPLAVGIDLGKTWIPEVSSQHKPYWHSSGIRKQWEAEQPCRKKTQHNVAFLVARGRGEFPTSSFFSLTFVLSANWHKMFNLIKIPEVKVQLPLAFLGRLSEQSTQVKPKLEVVSVPEVFQNLQKTF